MNYNDYIVLKSTPIQGTPIALDPVMDIDSIRVYSLLRHLSVEERLLNIGSIQEQLGEYLAYINVKKSLIRLELYRYISIEYIKHDRYIIIYLSVNDIINVLHDNKSYQEFVRNDAQFEYRDKLYAHQTQTIINDYLAVSTANKNIDDNPDTTGIKNSDDNPATTGTKNSEGNPDTTGIKNSEGNPVITDYKNSEGNPVITDYKNSDGNPVTTGYKNADSNPVTTGYKNSEGNPDTTGIKNSEGNLDTTGIKNSEGQFDQITKPSVFNLDNPSDVVLNSQNNENLDVTSPDFSGILSSILLNNQKKPHVFSSNCEKNENNSLIINELIENSESISDKAIDNNYISIDDTHTIPSEVSQLVSNNINNTYLPTESTTVVNSIKEHSKQPELKNDHLASTNAKCISTNHKKYSYDDLDWLSINLSTSNFIFDNFIQRKITLSDAQTIITVIDHKYQSGLVIHSLSAFLNKLFQTAKNGTLYNPKNIVKDSSESKNRSQEQAQLRYHHVTYTNFIENNQLEAAATYLSERNLQWDGQKIIFKEILRCD